MASLASMILCILGLGCLFVSGMHWLHGLIGNFDTRKANIESAKWMLAAGLACIFASVAVSSIGGV